jgi:hypothetical protein
MKTQTIEVDNRFGEEYRGTYELRQVTQGEYEQILVSYMNTLGKVSKQDILKVNREMLWLALKKQPENQPLTREKVVLGQVPYGLSIRLQDAYDQVNGLSLEEQRFLSETSGDEDLTRGCQSLCFVNDSAGQKQNTKQQAGEQLLSFRQSSMS